jgi:hypothetical protein
MPGRQLENYFKQNMEHQNMASFPESMQELKRQLEKGYLQVAYRGLMEYFRDLKLHFTNAHPEYPVSGGTYYGYMDMTYFALFPDSLKARKLKIAIVFIYETFRFEVWLSGSNRSVQTKYWKLLQKSDWRKYQFASNPKAEDYVLAHVLVDDPDFSDLDSLTKQIKTGTLEFIRDVEGFLSRRGN